jgi:hypothetical protein
LLEIDVKGLENLESIMQPLNPQGILFESAEKLGSLILGSTRTKNHRSFQFMPSD